MIKLWWNTIMNSKLVNSIFDFAKRIKPWGFEGLSLFDVSKFFLEGLMKGAVSTRSAAISYRLLIAIFPVVIVLFSCLPYIPIDNFQEILFDWLSGFFPGNTFQYVQERIEILFERGYSSIISIGSILSIWYASASVNAIMLGFNGSYHLDDKGNFIILRLVSIVLFILLGLLLLIAIALIIFSGMIFDELLSRGWLTSNAHIVLNLAQLVLSVSMIYGSITILYNIGDLKDRKWKTFSAGATFTTVLFLISTLGFSWFLEHFNTYSALYSTLGNLLVLLIWLNLSCTILLLGFDLNTSIKAAKLSGLSVSNAINEE